MAAIIADASQLSSDIRLRNICQKAMALKFKAVGIFICLWLNFFERVI
jgi:hypothetical protein